MSSAAACRCRLLFTAVAWIITLHVSASASAADGDSLEWSPGWRKVGLVEGLGLIPMGGALLAIELAWTPPQTPDWTGGIFFDSKIRNAFVGQTRSTQKTARDIGNALFLVGSVAPIVVDVGVTLAIHQKPDIAWQMLLIDLQSAAMAGLISLTSEHSVGRGRPFVGQCEVDGSVRDSRGRLLLNRCSRGNEAKSFYSGHSAATMTSAGLTCLTHQRLPIYGGGAADVVPCALMVGVSITTGITRIVADMHWASDVVIGWAIGAVSGYVLPAALHYGFSSDPESPASVHWLPVAFASADRVELGVAGAF